MLDALEERYPVLRGTIRDQATRQRRPFVRFFACEEDLSHEPPDAPLPDAVAAGDGAVPGHRRDGRRLTQPPADPPGQDGGAKNSSAIPSGSRKETPEP